MRQDPPTPLKVVNKRFVDDPFSSYLRLQLLQEYLFDYQINQITLAKSFARAIFKSIQALFASLTSSAVSQLETSIILTPSTFFQNLHASLVDCELVPPTTIGRFFIFSTAFPSANFSGVNATLTLLFSDNIGWIKFLVTPGVTVLFD